MSIQLSEVDVPGDALATNTHDPTLGVRLSRSCIDAPYKLQVIDRVLVSGGTFLDRFLQLATIEHCVVPGCGGQPIDVAIVRTQSLRVLGRQIGMCNDTIGKYVLFFLALGLLYKRRHRTSIELYFPLHHYQLPTIEDLDHFITSSQDRYRRAVLRGAHAMRGRFALLYSSTITPTSSASSDEKRTSTRSLHCTREELQSILDEEGVDLQTSDRVLGKLTRLQSGYRPRRLSDSSVDFDTSSVYEQNRLSPTSVDSDDLDSEQRDGLSHVDIDYKNASGEEGRRLLPTSVDSGVSPEATHSSLAPKGVDSQLQSPQKRGLSSASVDSDATAMVPNVNVITFIKRINVNVSLVAKFCCQALREHTGKLGVYQKLFRECEYDAKSITAALIYTLAHRQDGTMRKPAAVFHKLCKKYHTEGIADEAAALVEHYGSLTYLQLLDALHEPRQEVVSHVSVQTTPVHRTPASLPPLPNALGLVPRIPLKPGGGLLGEDAMRLRGMIAHDRRLGLCRTGITPLADGTYAVLIDNTVTHIVHQVAFYSFQEWQEHSATMTSCTSLFAPGKEPSVHPLRKLLQERSCHE